MGQATPQRGPDFAPEDGSPVRRALGPDGREEEEEVGGEEGRRSGGGRVDADLRSLRDSVV
eukprot:2673429-Rhodomonas_salina.2